MILDAEEFRARAVEMIGAMKDQHCPTGHWKMSPETFRALDGAGSIAHEENGWPSYLGIPVEVHDHCPPASWILSARPAGQID